MYLLLGAGVKRDQNRQPRLEAFYVVPPERRRVEAVAGAQDDLHRLGVGELRERLPLLDPKSLRVLVFSGRTPAAGTGKHQ